MKFRNQWLRYMAPATGDEGGGNAGGGDGNTDGAKSDQGTQDDAGKGADADKAKGTDTDGDGKGKLSDTEAKLLREVMQNKQARKDAEAQVNELKTKLAQFEGINLDEVTALLNERRAAEERRLAEQGNWDALKAQMAEQNAAAIKAVRDELEAERASKQSLLKQLEETSIGSAFAGSAFIQNELVLTPAKTRVVYGQHFDVVDGQVVAFDKPRGADGRTMLVDGYGEPLGFDEALRRLVEADPERDELVRSRIKPGAGSGTDKPTGDKKAGQKNENLHGIERINAGLASLLTSKKK